MALFRSYDEVAPAYCRFCGSRDVQQVQYSTMNTWGRISGVNVNVAGTGGGVNLQNGQQGTVYRPTMYCRTCRKIDVLDFLAPQEVVGHIQGYGYKFIIPGELQRGLASLDVDTPTLKDSLEELSIRMKKNIHKFSTTGTNPCKKGEYGFGQKIYIKSNPIMVRLIMENVQGQVIVRVVFDGGASQCP